MLGPPHVRATTPHAPLCALLFVHHPVITPHPRNLRRRFLQVERACQAAGISEQDLALVRVAFYDFLLKLRNALQMPSGQRRKVADDMTCVCVLRKSLLHKFVKQMGGEGCESRGGGAKAAEAEAEAQEAADARKRQKSSS